jgi:hypothetical protein
LRRVLDARAKKDASEKKEAKKVSQQQRWEQGTVLHRIAELVPQILDYGHNASTGNLTQANFHNAAEKKLDKLRTYAQELRLILNMSKQELIALYCEAAFREGAEKDFRGNAPADFKDNLQWILRHLG